MSYRVDFEDIEESLQESNEQLLQCVERLKELEIDAKDIPSNYGCSLAMTYGAEPKFDEVTQTKLDFIESQRKVKKYKWVFINTEKAIKLKNFLEELEIDEDEVNLLMQFISQESVYDYD